MTQPVILAAFLVFSLAAAQQSETPPGQAAAPAASVAQSAATPAQSQTTELKNRGFVVETGTRIPLTLINSVSTKSAAVGDRIYLETAFPVVVSGKIVIPPGSYVAGTVTQVKRAGRVKGKAELFVRFDSLTLPNGVTRDFRGRVGTLDGTNAETLDRDEGKISGEGNKSGDAIAVGQAASYGAMAGGLAGMSGMGAGIGAAAGATAAMIGILMTRGPDAILERGSTLEMILDRNIRYSDEELQGIGPATRGVISSAQEQPKSRGIGSSRPFPFQ